MSGRPAAKASAAWARKGAGRLRSEHVDQTVLVARIRQFFPTVLVFAIPNGGAREKGEAYRLKEEGVLAGVPDLFVAEPRGEWCGLFVEMKRADRGHQVSGEQARVHAWLTRKGYAVAVAAGLDEGWDAVNRYLGVEA
jgi:hypothetical protein